MSRWSHGLPPTTGCRDRVFASDGATNLKGARKGGGAGRGLRRGRLRLRRQRQGRPQDLGPRRPGAGGRAMPPRPRALEPRASRSTRIDGGWTRGRDLKAFRPHQWVKNLLLFVPLLAAHVFLPWPWLVTLLGAGRLLARGLVDLRGQRPARPRGRPAARHQVPPPLRLRSPCRSASAWRRGWVAGVTALAHRGADRLGLLRRAVAFYMALSLAYSLRLKRLRWIDIATLAALYTLRVMAGALASGVDISGYLLVFIYPVFIALGSVKRLTELTLAKIRRAAAGARLRPARPGRSAQRRGARAWSARWSPSSPTASPTRRSRSTRRAGCSGWRSCRSCVVAVADDPAGLGSASRTTTRSSSRCATSAASASC